MDNAESVGQGTRGDTHWYTGYHGYWPRDLDQTESRFGTTADLQTLVDHRARDGIKVLFDYAMNHVHQDSPTYQAHMNDGWFNPLMQNGETCVCRHRATLPVRRRLRQVAAGSRDYLPDWNFNNAAARALLRRQRAHVDQDLRLRRLPPRRGQADRAGLAHRLPHARSCPRSKRPPSSTSTWSARPSPAIRTSSSRSSIPCTKLDGQFDFPLRAQLVQNVLMRQGKMHDLIALHGHQHVVLRHQRDVDLPRQPRRAAHDPLRRGHAAVERRLGQRQGSQLVRISRRSRRAPAPTSGSRSASPSCGPTAARRSSTTATSSASPAPAIPTTAA